VIGVVQVGQQAYADRYTYIPLIGFFIALVWGGAELAERWRCDRRVVTGLAVVMLAVLAVAPGSKHGIGGPRKLSFAIRLQSHRRTTWPVSI
jgi:hypothetical protein